jgi:hypothetical protein
MESTTRVYTYIFTIPEMDSVSFTVSLDSVSHYITTCPVVPPEWSRLPYHQCTPCPLTVERHPFCPVALAIADLVIAFRDTASYDQCTVACVSSERTVTKKTTVQEGLASILGLLMATSGCPIMDFFRPMARFHLPFSSVEESIFRIVAMYMLRQYYRRRPDERSDPLEEIRTHYSLVQLVNAGMLERIRNITALDADKNALVTLTSLAQILELEIDTNLESLQSLFADS